MCVTRVYRTGVLVFEVHYSFRLRLFERAVQSSTSISVSILGSSGGQVGPYELVHGSVQSTWSVTVSAASREEVIRRRRRSLGGRA